MDVDATAARPGEERVAERASAVVLVDRDRTAKPGSITTTPSGGFARCTVQWGWIDHPVPAAQAGELRELIALREETLTLIDAQSRGR